MLWQSIYYYKLLQSVHNIVSMKYMICSIHRELESTVDVKWVNVVYAILMKIFRIS